MEEFEERLVGGNMAEVVRIGLTVRRPAEPWSSTVQRLLRHLRDLGVDWVPEPMGTDNQGRSVVGFLPGLVPQDPMPDWVWRDHVLESAGRRLAELHAASASFGADTGPWQLPRHEPAEVICHNDFAPYNMVFNDFGLTGVIDWDAASPGPRLWDVAYLAYRIVPLMTPGHPDGIATDLSERVRRLRLLCDVYNSGLRPHDVLAVAIERLHELAHFTEARAGQSRPDLRSHVDLYLRDAEWIGVTNQQLGLDE